MGLSIADIDRWDAGAVSAVGAAGAARMQSATQAGSALTSLPAFDTWKGPAANAAVQLTQSHADGINAHGQDAAGVRNAANTGAGEITQIKSQLSSIRSSAASWGITIDPATSKAMPPANFDQLPKAKQKLVQAALKNTQAAVDRLRTAADKADGHLAKALKDGNKSKSPFRTRDGEWKDPNYHKERTKDFGERKGDDQDKKPKQEKPNKGIGLKEWEAKTKKVGVVTDKELVKGEGQLGKYGPKVQGSVTMDALSADAGAKGKITSTGISGAANANATLVGAEAKGSLDKGPLHAEATGRAAVEASASADGFIGKDGMSASAEAFAGARLTGDAKADVAGVGAAAHGELQAGIGASADLDASFKDGHAKFGGSVGACLGVGGKGSFEVDIDTSKVTHSVTSGAKKVAGWLGF